MSHQHPFPGNELGIVDFTGEYLEEPPARRVTTDLNAANVMSSHFTETLHRPVLDLDIGATLVPSTTPGHSHLYLDTPMSWERYEALLVALAAAGIIEPRYATMSIQRHASYVRLPWIRKERPTMAKVPASQRLDPFELVTDAERPYPHAVTTKAPR